MRRISSNDKKHWKGREEVLGEEPKTERRRPKKTPKKTERRRPKKTPKKTKRIRQRKEGNGM
jgi:hypothetical protein